MEDSWRGNERKEKHQEAGKDDYAASTLEMLGIPQSDPVWYEIQCESFNYHDGIGVCLNMIRLNHAIISLAFHPSGEVLAVASGSTLHLWDYDEEDRKLKKKQELEHVASRNPAEKTNNNASHSRISESRILNRDSTSEFPSSRTLNISHESALRCVHFPPCGTTLIIGGVNPPSANEGLAHRHPRGRGGMSGGGMSFHLRLWEFDLEATLNAPVGSSADPPNVPNNGTHLLGASVSDEGDVTWNFSSMRRALSNVSLMMMFLAIVYHPFCTLRIPLITPPHISHVSLFHAYCYTMMEDLIYLRTEKFSQLVLNIGKFVEHQRKCQRVRKRMLMSLHLL